MTPRLWLALPAALLGACAQLGPTPPTATPPDAPPQWQAPLPHAGSPGELARWWQQFDDPLLPALIEAAQAASPTVAAARSRIEQARAARVAAGAALGPTLDATASASYGRFDLQSPRAGSASVGLQAGWELDLFGAGRAGRDAAQARFEGAQAAWHEARVSVAAETASGYLALRACEAQLLPTEQDATSRAETARLTELAAQAGFQPPASAELARASAAQGNAALSQLRAQCALQLKALVALTGQAEPALREQLAAGRARLPQPAALGVAAVPGAVLAQRPDLYDAERELAAAAADAEQARAQRWPRVTLAGSIAPTRLWPQDGPSLQGTVWSVGPLAVTLPIFDGGRRAADAEAARARYDAAAAAYAARLRTAVREVEEALVALDSTAARGEDARVAAQGYERSFRAVESRYRGGLASLFELEDARRSALAAQSALIDLQRERVAAWIALYRSLGGGWTAADLRATARE
ncbi:MAG: efflux transporter outer membrane subunit [Piscinibacter sp.]|uniref:efflux transporter outer membrane subunit n=1 Tax=Piscinibacter sp. TaxID=1903157 RepID=UPI00258DDED8|nr:efflux transporter outer membrane subunit [Piscinibacter sp.]MCW5664994.1 efflux transporter outer membrane subunit [Piscinibacter sp.]